MSQQGKVYREQGGDTLVVASGGTLRVESGGTLELNSGAGFTSEGTTRLNVAAYMKGHTVTAGQATANAAVIATGLPAITGTIVQILRTGVDVTADAVITASGGDVTVADGALIYNMTAGDVINLIAWAG